MRLQRRPFSAVRIASYCLFALSIVILGISLYFTSNITVLENWTLTAPDGDKHVGDQVVVISKYTKTKKVTGSATRYIECRNRNGVFIRYPLNQATANRQTGAGGTGFVLVIPRTLPDLPASCKFSVSVVYPVLPFHPTTEYNSTGEFRVLPEATDGQGQQTNPVP